MHAKWVPARVTLDPRRSEIQWVDCAGVSFEQPFFDQSMARLEERERFVSGLAHEPGIDAAAILRPAAFIFHVSRCGSTLLANALRALDGAIAISEPQPVNAALAAGDAALFARMMRYLSQPLTGREHRLFFKFTSWNIARLAMIRALFPETPAIFLCRDPLEVMVSNFGRGGGWMELKDAPREAQALFGWRDADPRGMPPEEFCARVLGHLCWTAKNFERERDVVLDYRGLTPASVCGILEGIGIAPTPAELDRMAAQFMLDAKDPRRARPFQPAAGLATARQIEAAERWAYPAYRRLLEPPRRL